jgi:hypothetical protein
MRAGPAVAAVLVAAVATSAVARECGEGRVTAGASASGDALEHYDCAMLARVYCRIAEDRDAGLGADASVRGTSDWLARLGGTGSHVRGRWEPILKIAADEVYRGARRSPGQAYYRAAYSCGLTKRLGDDAAARRQAGTEFDAAVARCEQAHPAARARSWPNRPLGHCLAAAVERIRPRAPAP